MARFLSKIQKFIYLFISNNGLILNDFDDFPVSIGMASTVMVGVTNHNLPNQVTKQNFTQIRMPRVRHRKINFDIKKL